MIRYLVERLIHGTMVVIGISSIVFVLVFLSGDPAIRMMPLEASPEQIAAFRHAMGFDRSLPEQYLAFMGRAVQGDLGQSLRYKRPALALVIERVPPTLQLTTAALVVSLIIALPLGILAALAKDGPLDHASRVIALLGQSVPTFLLGIFLILVVAVSFRWLPASGAGTAKHLVLPAITLGTYSAAILMRLLRSSLVDVLGRDYIRTARGKGLPGRVILIRHALKNASIPVLTVIALQVGALFGGAVITETVFAYPGMGLLAVQAIRNLDFPVVQAFVITVGGFIVVMNVAIDLAYTRLDPRVRLG